MRVHRFAHGRAACLVISYPIRRPAVLASLNPAELAVLEAVLEGTPQRAIAAQRGVAPRTVANQLASAYRKLGVRGAHEAAALLRGSRC